jgi:hypothetical protein
VSEIVAVLLLVAVAVGMGVIILYGFASGDLGSLTGGASGLISNEGNAVAENFVVEQAVFSFTGTTGASVYVLNVGTTSSTLVSVYIVDQSTGKFVTQVAVDQALSVGSLVDIPQTTLTFTPSHGNTYSFTVTSSLGNSVTFDEEAA